MLKLPTGEVYDMHAHCKNRKKVGVTELVNLFPLLRVTGTIAIAQPLLNFFNKDPTKNGYLVIIYIQENMVFYSESKTIDVHCRGARMSFPIFSDMLFWEACAKNVKYYKL